MSTGRVPFVDESVMATFDTILHQTPRPPSQFNPELPLEVERIIGKALEKDRDLRYQSAAEVRSDLKRLKRDLESGSLQTPAQTAFPTGRGLSARMMVLLGLLVAAVAVALTLWLGSPAAPARVVNSLQLTSDALPKTSLVTDGARIYLRNESRALHAATGIHGRRGKRPVGDVSCQHQDL